MAEGDVDEGAETERRKRDERLMEETRAKQAEQIVQLQDPENQIHERENADAAAKEEETKVRAAQVAGVESEKLLAQAAAQQKENEQAAQAARSGQEKALREAAEAAKMEAERTGAQEKSLKDAADAAKKEADAKN